MDVNLTFCRRLLSAVLADVESDFPGIDVRDAAVLKLRGFTDYWLFEYIYQGQRFTWEGKADNAYHARIEGWRAFQRKFGKKEE